MSTIKYNSIEEYIDQVDENKKESIIRLRQTILENIPSGFTETISYGMIGYVVPHSLYPQGYHCTPELPLPFMALAAQKHFIGLYHLGIYADPTLYDWFINQYPKHCKSKLDMGKSCIRFKKMNDIPYDLIGELSRKMTVDDWVALYTKAFIKK